MNLLQLRMLFASLALIGCLACGVAFADTIQGAELTVYNTGRALVTESRAVNLPKGLASVVFKDVPTTIEPTSVRASATGMRVLGLQYGYTPITEKNLLDRFVGKEVTLVIPDPADANARVARKATLLSNAQSPIFQMDGTVYVGSYQSIQFPTLPKDLQVEPTLTLTTDNASAGQRNVALSYLMEGLKWQADYRLTLNAEGTKGALDGWASLDNASGRGFVNADLKLVAGTVKRANVRPKLLRGNAPMAMEAAAVSDSAQEEEVSQFHVYSVDSAVSLPATGTKQVALLSKDAVTVKQELVSRFYGNRRLGREATQPVEVALLLENVEKTGLGVPLPAGLVRVFMPTADGRLILAGEPRLAHLAIGGKARLPLGESFDVTVKRAQTAYDKIGKNIRALSWRMELRNGKSTAQEVVLRENYSGDWTVTDANREYTMPDAATLEFVVQVPPTKDGEPVVVTYSVEITQ